MPISPHTVMRELDQRHSDGIDVRLLWDPRTNSVSIALRDERKSEELTFPVDASDALNAFQHPYAYAPNPRTTPEHTDTSLPPGRNSDLRPL